MQWPLPPTKKSHTGSPCVMEHFLHGAHLSTAYTPCNPDVCILAQAAHHSCMVFPPQLSCTLVLGRHSEVGCPSSFGEWPTNAASVRAEKYLAAWPETISSNPFWESLEATLMGFVPPMMQNCCREINSYAAQIDFLLLNGLLCLHSNATSLSLDSDKY